MVRGALHGSIVVASYKPSKDAENEAKRSVKRYPASCANRSATHK